MKFIRVEDKLYDITKASLHRKKPRGVYVYDIDYPINRPINRQKWLVNMQTTAKIFSQNINKRFGLSFELQEFYPKLDCINLDMKQEPEWTQFYFIYCNNERGICLKQLKLSPRLQHKGIGTYCVNWLKQFAYSFGFNYIILGSLDSAEGFWWKMGFRQVASNEERDKLLP